jgi:hypothetical protein
MPSKSWRMLWVVSVIVLLVIVVISSIWITGQMKRMDQTRAMSTAMGCRWGIAQWVEDNPGLSREQIYKMTLDDFVLEGAISAHQVAKARQLNLLFHGYDPEASPSTVLFEREQTRWWKKTRMVFRFDGSWKID